MSQSRKNSGHTLIRFIFTATIIAVFVGVGLYYLNIPRISLENSIKVIIKKQLEEQSLIRIVLTTSSTAPNASGSNRALPNGNPSQ